MAFRFTAVGTVDAAIRRRIGPLVTRSVALPSIGTATAERADLVDQRRGDLFDEARRRVVVGVAEQLPAPGMREEQALLGTGDAHVGQAALLFQFGRLGERPG